MAKKDKRLSKDAFDWVQDTSGKSEEDKTASKERPAKSTGATKETGTRKARKVFVRYIKKSGQIMAVQEMSEALTGDITNPWAEVPKEQQVETFELSGNLKEKGLLDIHTNYRVDTGGKKPKLVSMK